MKSDGVIRVAMWSGPRNISTAMMRAWENRADTSVVDEPFYACFLTATGIIHPMQEEVLASQSSDWDTVIRTELSKPLNPGEKLQYQKHMTQHMVAEIDGTWFTSLKHAFLIRHPAGVVASYSQKRESVTADDIGFAKQKELYDLTCSLTDQSPPIIDARDVLTDPKNMLSKLCGSLGVPFSQEMLKWPSGRRDSDGVWAPHWYHNVEQSTGFGPYRDDDVNLTNAEQEIVDQCLPYYQFLYDRRLALD